MNTTLKKTMLFASSILLCSCGTSPIRAVHISNEKNIWIEEIDSGLFYCTSGPSALKDVDPVCYPARRSTSKDAKMTQNTPVDSSLETKETNVPKELTDSKPLKSTSH